MVKSAKDKLKAKISRGKRTTMKDGKVIKKEVPSMLEGVKEKMKPEKREKITPPSKQIIDTMKLLDPSSVIREGEYPSKKKKDKKKD